MEAKQTFLFFPGGYSTDIGNLDVNVIVGDLVYFTTCFTPENVNELMLKDNEYYFWSVDMLIVKDLSIRTISHAIAEIIREDSLSRICSYIGNLQEVYDNREFLEEELYRLPYSDNI
jgi:hypothetical protein